MRRLILFIMLFLSVCASAGARQAPPSLIEYGETVDGNLDDVQRALQYIFEAGAGDEIIIEMSATSGDLNPALALSTFDGDVLATDDDSGGGLNARIEFTIERRGSYIITASRSRVAVNGGGNGSFSLSLISGTAVENTDTGAEAGAETEAGNEPVYDTVPRMQAILRGMEVRGTLNPPTRFNLYWFEGHDEQDISILPDNGTGFIPLLVLYDSEFTEITRNSTGSGIVVTLSGDDIYFIAVAIPENREAGGNYALTLTDTGMAASAGQDSAPREVQPGQTSIAYGESVRGNINAGNNAYTFQFSGNTGDVVIINMARAGGDLDSYLYLLTSGGVIIAEDDNSGTANGDSLITATLPETGEYIILATRKGQDSGSTSGSFLLELKSNAQPAEVAPTAAPMTTDSDRPANLIGLPEIHLGESIGGEISDANFLQVYVFEAKAGDNVTISMESPDRAVDTLLLLLDSNQVPLADNDDISDTNKNSLISEFIIPADGYYAIVATRYEQADGTTTGEYILSLNYTGVTAAERNTSFAQQLNAGRISPGSTPEGSFAPLRFASVYAFGLTEGSVVDFSVATDDNSAATVIMTDSQLEPVASTDGGTLLSIDIPESDNYLFFVAPAAGPAKPASTPYILAFNATGERFELNPEEEGDTEEAVVVSNDPIFIAYGETEAGAITNNNPAQEYIFTGIASDIVLINMTAAPGSTLDTYIELFDSYGNLVGENDDIVNGENRNSELQVTLPADGEYTIRATRFQPTDGTTPTTGDYTLSLVYRDPEQAGISSTVLPIDYGETVSNTINEERYLHFYAFQGSSGDVITITVNTRSGDLDSILYLYAYTSAGEPILIAQNDDSSRGNTFDPLIEGFRLPRTGEYLIAVGRYPDRPSSGDFSLTLTVSQ